jgi:DNA repair protein RecO (recombination protein O)
MLHTTGAISLSYIRYRETSIIARFFTEQFGLQAFVVNSVRSAKSKTSLSLFQPLGLVELIQYHDPRKDLNRMKEIRPEILLKTIPFHPGKSAIAMFMAEYLGKVLREGQPNPPLYEMAREWVLQLDQKTENYDAMHIALVWNSLGPLGILPNEWQDILPAGVVPNREQTEGLELFFAWMENGGEVVPVSGAMKQWILDVLLLYIRSQLEGMGNLQSLSVLRQVFS